MDVLGLLWGFAIGFVGYLIGSFCKYQIDQLIEAYRRLKRIREGAE